MVGFQLAFNGDKYVLLALGTVIYCYGGLPFLKGMIGEVKAKAIGMMTLVAIAISVAYVYSVAVVFGLQGMDFFWELATLIDIMLLGHWLEMRSQMAASRALQSLVALLPNDVTVERGGEAVKIKLEDLQSGETAIIKPGEKIPADGLVLEGFRISTRVCLPEKVFPVKRKRTERSSQALSMAMVR
jgi:Cu2+-exporting ATPase